MPTWLRELRQAAGWHRRLLAAGLLAAAVALTISEVTPEPPPTVRVLAAAHDLAAGEVLGAGDVRTVELVPGNVPEGAVRDRGELDGRTLVGPVRMGEVITDVRLVGRSYLEAYGEELVAAPVRIGDAASARLLRPGDVVDVLAAAPPTQADGAFGDALLVASGVRVVTVPRGDDGLADLSEGALVVLATTSETAARLAAAAVTARLSVTIRGR